jgi:hypothetical protein
MVSSADLLLFAKVLEFMGKVLLAFSVIIVHSRIRREGKIDWAVLHELDIDRTLTYVALTILTIGFGLYIYVTRFVGA